jgi:hypothetical protein
MTDARLSFRELQEGYLLPSYAEHLFGIISDGEPMLALETAFRLGVRAGVHAALGYADPDQLDRLVILDD